MAQLPHVPAEQSSWLQLVNMSKSWVVANSFVMKHGLPYYGQIGQRTVLWISRKSFANSRARMAAFLHLTNILIPGHAFGWSWLLRLLGHWLPKRASPLTGCVEREPPQATTGLAGDDQDVGPRLLGALALVLNDRGAGLALDHEGVAVLADGVLQRR